MEDPKYLCFNGAKKQSQNIIELFVVGVYFGKFLDQLFYST